MAIAVVLYGYSLVLALHDGVRGFLAAQGPLHAVQEGPVTAHRGLGYLQQPA